MKSKENSWVLITGASSGFGKTLSAQLRERFGVEVLVEQADLSSIPAIIELHERLRERNIVIDALINNAGHGLQGPFLDQPLDESLA